MSTIPDEYKAKFQISDNNNPFIHPELLSKTSLYGPVTQNQTVYDPIKTPEEPINTPVGPAPQVVTYNKMRWNSKTAMANPHRAFSVTGQNLMFTKNLMLPRRVGILTNNVPKSAVTDNCYTPANNNVIINNN